MALKDLLYRCPRCGHDPTDGAGDEARCPGCGSVFERAGEGAGIRVSVPDDNPKVVPAGRLTAAIGSMGGPLARARRGDGELRYEAAVEVRRSDGEQALRLRRELLGFHERLSDGEPGWLRVTGEALELEEEGTETVRARWNLMDLRAVQSSSSAVQIYTAAGELVHFHFVDDSPVRWEALLHVALREAYEREGRGSIVEFQPRIRVR